MFLRLSLLCSPWADRAVLLRTRAVLLRTYPRYVNAMRDVL
jgi:hypothetical protein